MTTLSGDPGDDATTGLPISDADAEATQAYAAPGPNRIRTGGGEPDSPVAIGDRIGSVQIQAVLGQGGMGTVFRGHDTKLDRPVAIKAVRRDHLQDPEARARFRREARTLSRLNHPGVCHVFDLVERAEADYLVLELVQGETLGVWLKTAPSLALRLAVGRRLAEALDAAHERGIVHRDLKPENVMVGSDGAVKVLDFGLARAQDSPVEDARQFSGETPSDAAFRTTLGLVMGTLAYMSPEQARGEEAGPATDIFALGAVLQELLAGVPIHPPLPHERLLRRVQRGEVDLAEGLEGDAARLVEELLSREPGARPTARMVASRLAALEAEPQRRRRRRLALAGATLVLLLAAGSALVAWHLARPAPLLARGARARLALLPVENATGESSFEWVGAGLNELMIRQLDHLEQVDLLPMTRVTELLEASAHRPVGEDLPLGHLATQLGVDLVIQVRALMREGQVQLEYRPGRPGTPSGSWRALTAPDPTEAADLLARELALRLAPTAPPVEQRDRLSADPFLNRLYAMGVDRLKRAGGRGAETYFRVCLDRDPGFVWARVRLVNALSATGRFVEAEAEGRRAESAARDGGDRPLLAETRCQLAMALQQQGRREEAERLVRTAVADLRTLDDRVRLAEALTQLGQIAWERGKPEDLAVAERLHREALALARASGDTLGIARSLRTLGVVADSRWDLPLAASLFRESLQTLTGMDRPAMRASILNSLGITLHYAGELDQAESALGEALKLNRTLANPTGEASNLINLGDLRLRHKDWAGAAAHFQEAMAISKRIGMARGQAIAALNMAEALARLGRSSEAEASLAVIGQAGADDWNVAFVRGLIAQARSDPSGAVSHFELARRKAGKGWEPRHKEALDTARRSLRRSPDTREQDRLPRRPTREATSP